MLIESAGNGDMIISNNDGSIIQVVCSTYEEVQFFDDIYSYFEFCVDYFRT